MGLVRYWLVLVAGYGAGPINFLVKAAPLRKMVLLKPMRSVNSLRRLSGPDLIIHVLGVVWREAHLSVPQTLIEPLAGFPGIESLMLNLINKEHSLHGALGRHQKGTRVLDVHK